jgi:hypothetical protein
LRFAFPLCCREDFGNLRWIDRRDHVAVYDSEFPASGLVCDGGYFSLDKFTAVEFDEDAGAYAVIHIVGILARTFGGPLPSITLIVLSRRALVLVRPVSRRSAEDLLVGKLQGTLDPVGSVVSVEHRWE